MLHKGVFKKFPVIQTNRLTLRQLQVEDAHAIFEMRSNSMVNRFIARHEMTEPDSAVELIARTNAFWKEKKGIAWAGVLRGKGEIIGTCGFNHIDYDNRRAELGGELSTSYWGKKLALEAVQAIVNFGFNNLNLHSIEAKVSPENRSAVALLENLGFVKEAHFRDRVFFDGTYSDLAVYTRFNFH